MIHVPAPRTATALIALATLTILSGCSMSGLDASNHFACKAPVGVACESMSGVYANLQAGNLPSQQAGKSISASAATNKTAAPGTGTLSRPLFSGTPIRSAPRLLRLWFAPWKDDDGDLYDQSYAYLVIDNGHWLIAHNQRRIRDTYKPSPVLTNDSDTAAQAPSVRSVPQQAQSWSVPPRAAAAPAPSNDQSSSRPSTSSMPAGTSPSVPPLSSDGPDSVTSATTSPADATVRQPALNDAAMRQFASGVRLPNGASVGPSTEAQP